MRTSRSTLAVTVIAIALALAGPDVARALEVGQPAPDFALPAPGGRTVKLSELTARGPLVVYTFIQAFTGT